MCDLEHVRPALDDVVVVSPVDSAAVARDPVATPPRRLTQFSHGAG